MHWFKAFLLMPLPNQNSPSSSCHHALGTRKLLTPPGNILSRICFPQQQKLVEKTKICLSKFSQKIWRWLGTSGLLHFVWFTIFSYVIALQFCKWYLSYSMALNLLILLCNHDNLILKLHQKKIANFMMGDFL